MNAMPINLQQKFSLFDERWSPKVVAEMNDYQFKVVKLEGEFVWHRHVDTDETFFVVDGALTIALRGGGDDEDGDGDGDREVHLAAGELFIVPKGIEHKPIATTECKVLLIEPRGVPNTGDGPDDGDRHARTAANDVWI